MSETRNQVYVKGRVVDFGISKTQKNDPQIFVNFEVDYAAQNDKEAFGPDQNVKRLTWYGYLVSEASREITLKALLCLGFTGDSLEEIAKGPEGKALDQARIVDLTCYEEKYNDNWRAKIGFINPPGGGAKIERLDASESKKALAGINLKAALKSVRDENPNLVKVSEGNAEAF